MARPDGPVRRPSGGGLPPRRASPGGEPTKKTGSGPHGALKKRDPEARRPSTGRTGRPAEPDEDEAGDEAPPPPRKRPDSGATKAVARRSDSAPLKPAARRREAPPPEPDSEPEDSSGDEGESVAQQIKKGSLRPPSSSRPTGGSGSGSGESERPSGRRSGGSGSERRAAGRPKAQVPMPIKIMGIAAPVLVLIVVIILASRGCSPRQVRNEQHDYDQAKEAFSRGQELFQQWERLSGDARESKRREAQRELQEARRLYEQLADAHSHEVNGEMIYDTGYEFLDEEGAQIQEYLQQLLHDSRVNVGR